MTSALWKVSIFVGSELRQLMVCMEHLREDTFLRGFKGSGDVYVSSLLHT